MNWENSLKQYSRFLAIEKSLSKNSLEAYKHDVMSLWQWNDLTHKFGSPLAINKFQLEQFSGWLSEIGFSATSQSRILSGIRGFYKFLVLEELLDESPADFLEMPRIGRKLPVVLSIEEIDQMVGAIDRSHENGERNVAILEAMYSCGLRVSEAVGLRVQDVFFDEHFVKVIGKGNKERLIPIGDTALKHLDIYIRQVRVHLAKINPNSRDIVFLSKRGAKMSRQSIFLLIKDLTEKCQIKKNISPHTFRHSFATHMVEAGADLRAVQQMLGHESITTTEIYTHLDRSYLADTILKYHPRSGS